MNRPAYSLIPGNPGLCVQHQTPSTLVYSNCTTTWNATREIISSSDDCSLGMFTMPTCNSRLQKSFRPWILLEVLASTVALASTATAAWMLAARRRLRLVAHRGSAAATSAGGHELSERTGLLGSCRVQDVGRCDELEAGVGPGSHEPPAPASGASWRLGSSSLRLRRTDFEFKSTRDNAGNSKLSVVGSGYTSTASDRLLRSTTKCMTSLRSACSCFFAKIIRCCSPAAVRSAGFCWLAARHSTCGHQGFVLCRRCSPHAPVLA